MFRLAISNIAWESCEDKEMYHLMKDLCFHGLEIAPTRIITKNPYDFIVEAKKWCEAIRKDYGFEIPSMQSLWFGRSERIFGTVGEREALVQYTQKAIEFAEALGCENLVFGCPHNRSIIDNGNKDIAIDFFKIIGNYAYRHHTVVAMEANPPIYGTNFINTTKDAINFVEVVNSKGFLLNLDAGTMIENGETIDVLKDKGHLINHVHISEPGLGIIKNRNLHQELCRYLAGIGYGRYISIEMKKGLSVREIGNCMNYIRGIFQ